MAQKATETLKTRVAQAFERVGRLTQKQRLLICAGVFLAIGGGYYYLVYSPKVQQLSQLTEDHERVAKNLDVYKARAKALPKWEKEMQAVEQEFNFAMEALPDKREIPAMLTGISQAGSMAGLDFLLFQPTAEVNKEFYKEIPLSMKVEGGYHQMADFFFRIAHMGRIININDLDMVRPQKGEGDIQMSCTAVTYMFVEPQDEGKDKDKGSKKGHKKG